MLIQTLNRRFSVILVRSASNDAEVYVCRDLWEEGDREYLLVAVKNPDLVYRCAPFFTAQTANRAFRDFVECFSRDGLFYVVFAYYAKPRFVDKFNEELFFLNERLDIGKSLLSRILLQNMPPSLLYEALQDRNLLLDDALGVYFNYDLEEIPAHGLFSLERVEMELGRIFRLILRRELATRVLEDIPAFIEDLEQCKFKDYMEIYEAYDKIYDKMTVLQETGELNPQNLLFRCWEWIKKMGRFLRPALAVVVLGTALVFLVYTITHPSVKPGAVPSTIDRIGTVVAK